MSLKILIICSLLLSIACTTETEIVIEVANDEALEYISMEDWALYSPKEKEKSSTFRTYVRDPNQVLENQINGIRIARFKTQGLLIDAVDKLNEIIRKQKYTKNIPLDLHFSVRPKGLSRSIDVEGINLNEALNIICDEYKVQRVIKDGRVIFGFYTFDDIKEKRIHHLSNDFARSLKGKDLKMFFQSSGVRFPKGASIELIQGNYLFAENLQENHRALEKVIVDFSYDIDQVLLVAQIFEVTKPEYLRNVVLPSARQIIAIPNEHRKVVSRIVTLGSSNSFVSDQKAKHCFIYDKNQKIKPSFIGTTFESRSIVDPDGITISIDFKWSYNVERSRRLVEESNKEYFVSDLNEAAVNQRIKLWDGESAVMPLSQDPSSRKFLIITPKIITSKFESLRELENGDPLAPCGGIELFRNKKTGQVRIFTPVAQDDYIKKLIEKRNE